MKMLPATFTLSAALALAAPALADKSPPEKAVSLSKLVAEVEQRPDFQFIKDIDWDSDGYYEIEYQTKSGGEVGLKIDPLTGEVRR